MEFPLLRNRYKYLQRLPKRKGKLLSTPWCAVKLSSASPMHHPSSTQQRSQTKTRQIAVRQFFGHWLGHEGRSTAKAESAVCCIATPPRSSAVKWIVMVVVESRLF